FVPDLSYVEKVYVPASKSVITALVSRSMLSPTFIALVASCSTRISYVPLDTLVAAVAVTADDCEDMAVFGLYVLVIFISSIILSNSNNLLLISRNASRFHSN